MSQPPPIYIQFAVRGLDDVQRAMKTIAETAAGAEKKSAAAVKAVVASAPALKKAASDVVTSVKGIAAAEANAAAASKAGLTKRARDFEKEAALRKKHGAATIAEINNLAKQIDGNDAKQAAAKKKRADDLAKYMNRVRENSFRMEQQWRDQELEKERKLTEAKKAEAKKRAGAYVNAAGKGISNGVGAVKGIVNGAMNAMGGFSVTEAVQGEVQLQGQAAALAASSTDRTSSKVILDRARQIGIEHGFDPSEIIAGFDNVKKLDGDKLEQAMRVAPAIAQVANATGSNFAELSGFAGNILAGAKEDGTAVSDDELKKMLLTFAQQGMSGAVEVGDFAKFGSRFTGGAKLFGGDQLANTVSLGALAQIARGKGTATTASEASMAALRFGTDIQKKSETVSGLIGKSVFDEKGNLRAPEELTMDIMKATDGRVDKLTQAGVGERAVKYLSGAGAIWREAGGGKKGEETLHAFFEKLRVTMKEDEVEAREKERLAAADKQIQIAMIELKTVVGTELVPELILFVRNGLIPALPAISQLTKGFAKVAEVLLNNPLLGVGAIISAAIVKEIAAVALGEAIKAALVNAIAGKLPGVASVAAPTAAGAAAAVGAGLVAGAGVAAVLYNNGTKYADGTNNAENLAAKVDAYARGDKANGISPERAQALVAQAKGRVDNTGAFSMAGNILASPFDDSADKKYGQYKADQALVDNEQLKKAITDAIKTGFAEAPRLGPSDPNHPGRGNSGPLGSNVRGRPL